ncbi:hypothetical protein LINPERHAP1_LOCUS8339 [Linum perenne]
MVSNRMYHGSLEECPVAHIENFLELCNTYKQQRVSAIAIRVMLFLFSLMGLAER